MRALDTSTGTQGGPDRGNEAQCSLKLVRPPRRCSTRLWLNLTRGSDSPGDRSQITFRASVLAQPPLGGRFNAAGSGSTADTACLPRSTRLRGDALGKHRSPPGAPRTPPAPGQRPLPGVGPRPLPPPPAGPQPRARRGLGPPPLTGRARPGRDPRRSPGGTHRDGGGQGRAVPGRGCRDGAGAAGAARRGRQEGGGGGPARPPRLRPPPRALKAPAPPRPGAPGNARPCPAPSPAPAHPRGNPGSGESPPGFATCVGASAGARPCAGGSLPELPTWGSRTRS